jgi:hypothetical protein
METETIMSSLPNYYIPFSTYNENQNGCTRHLVEHVRLFFYKITYWRYAVPPKMFQTKFNIHGHKTLFLILCNVYISGHFKKFQNYFFYNFFRQACNWVSLIAFKALPYCIDAPLPMPLPLVETILGCLFGIMRSSVCKFYVISWIVWNLHPFKVDFSLGNMKKSIQARSGEEAQLCSCCP